jgi:plastocyanin
MPSKILGLVLALGLVPLGLMTTARAADQSSVVIVIKDHRFVPAEVTVPAGKRVELVIENQDTTPAEFESNDLRREKVVVGKGRISVWLGPLPAGTYVFFDDFHQATARGKLTAR